MKIISGGLALGVLFGLPAAAVSRVGNTRVGDSNDGFTVEIPRTFLIERETSSESVLLENINFDLNPWANIRSRILVQRMAREYPEFASSSSEEFTEHFSSQSAWEQVSNPDSCVSAFITTNANTVTALAAWGPGRGVVIVGSPAGQVVEGARAMLMGLQLAPGACEWK